MLYADCVFLEGWESYDDRCRIDADMTGAQTSYLSACHICPFYEVCLQAIIVDAKFERLKKMNRKPIDLVRLNSEDMEDSA